MAYNTREHLAACCTIDSEECVTNTTFGQALTRLYLIFLVKDEIAFLQHSHGTELSLFACSHVRLADKS